MKGELHILLLCSCVFVGCTKHQPSGQTSEQDSVTTSVELVSDEVDTICAAVPKEMQKPLTKEEKMTAQRLSQITSSSYSSSQEERGDYWEEKRMQSPNDNYLLGFDEDIDDVHDMELYMEDY